MRCCRECYLEIRKTFNIKKQVGISKSFKKPVLKTFKVFLKTLPVQFVGVSQKAEKFLIYFMFS